MPVQCGPKIMFEMFSLITILITSLIVFIASFVQGLTAFGFALFTVPILIVFLPPKLAIPTVAILGSMITAVILFKERKSLSTKSNVALSVSGIVGTPLGTYLLLVLNSDVMKVFVGSVVVVTAIALFLGFKRTVGRMTVSSVFVGLASGLLSGSTSMGGPPVILFFANQEMKKKMFKANLAAYFTVLNLATMGSFILSGLLNFGVFIYSLTFVPSLALGGVTGILLEQRLREKSFRKIVLILMIIAGLISIVVSFSAPL